MGHKHTKEQLLDGALAVAFDDGLSQVSFGRVARRLGINDRTIVYYFPTKHDLIAEILTSMGAQLQGTLALAFAERAPDHRALIAAAWPVLASPEADPVFALFFEANGLAAAGREPFASIVPDLVEAWVAWTSELVDGSPEQRRAEAGAAIAVLDGLLLLRQLAGPAVAESAATRLIDR